MSSGRNFFKEEQETIPLDKLKELQLDKLRKSIEFVAAKSDFYKNKKNITKDLSNITSFEEFANKIPFTTKEDLVNSDIYENLCVPKEDIAEIHFSSGTSNKPVFSFLSEKDIEESSLYLSRTWFMQGVRKESVFALFASYGLFSAGLINHYAIQKIGPFIIPTGNATALKTFQLINDFSVDSCAAVASYYLYLINEAEKNKVNLESLALKHIIAGGEPFSEKQRVHIENKFGGHLYDQYGLCEINTGLAGECSEKNGLHILADYVYPEIIDPATGDVLGEDQEGELVLTTFHKEASPLLRYRTGDKSSISYKVCPCGRTMPRIARIKGRVTDTLFYKGLKIEKPYVANFMEDLGEHINPYVWQMIAQTHAGRDELVIKVIPTHQQDTDLKYISAYIQKKMNIRVNVVTFTDEELLPLGNSKIKHFVDLRE
jgi:phenylacetate-CoA ligase